MTLRASWPLKLAYCFVILAAAVPVGVASSGWVAATLGRGASPVAGLTMLGPLILLVVGLYRIWTVLRLPGTLNAFQTSGAAKILRIVGLLSLYIGALVAIASWLARPVIRMLVPTSTESGVEYYIVGVYLGLVSGIGVLGLILFELSRLLSFEAEARR